MRIDPENLLNFRLWRFFTVAGAPVTRLCEGRYGVTRREWHLLILLFRDGPVSPSELAERAALDRPRVSKAVAGLVAKSLLRRTAGRDSRCRFILTLTDKGVQLVLELFPQMAAINMQVLSAIPLAAQDAFFAALDAMTRHADAVARSAESGLPPPFAVARGGSRAVLPRTTAQQLGRWSSESVAHAQLKGAGWPCGTWADAARNEIRGLALVGDAGI